MLTRLTLATIALAATALALPTAQPQDPRALLIDQLNTIAFRQLDARARAVAHITTRAAAERRRATTRATILRLIGGVPARAGAVPARTFGEVAGDGFRMEKVAYESQPGFWVTANLFLPVTAGRFPAVVLAPGHGAAGKTESWSWGVNFARNGIAVLSYDPIGQGERLQYYDPARQASYVGNPTGEHGEANLGPLLLGDTVAQYMVNDAMRGIDYLLARGDIDSGRIGAFGCSGGGVATALLAALDDRVSVAASACYITSFRALLTSATGVQEAEQSLPRFIEQGLDFPDWITAFAPKPYAIVFTEADMFPFDGARATVEEARRTYALYGAADRVRWITGPGGHGNLAPIAPAILGFFTLHLKGQQAPPVYQAVRAERPDDMRVTPSGQVSTSIGTATVASLTRDRLPAVATPAAIPRGAAGLTASQARLRADIRELTGAVVQPGRSGVRVQAQGSVRHDGYRLDTIAMSSDGAAVVSGLLALPDRSGPRPAAILMDTRSAADVAAPGGEVERLARSGVVVLVLEARPTPPGTESIKSPYLGPFNLLSLRAFLVGRSLVGLRVDDVIRAVDWMTARADVATLTVHGVGPHGIVALHAAVLDGRISRLVMERSVASYRSVAESAAPRDVPEILVPGVLRRYDTGDLLLATFPRPVRILAPRDAAGEPLTAEAFDRFIQPLRAAERAAGRGSGERIVTVLEPH